MSPLVRSYLKTAIRFRLAGLGLGGWMLLRRELLGQYASPYLISVHTHLLLVGFVAGATLPAYPFSSFDAWLPGLADRPMVRVV